MLLHGARPSSARPMADQSDRESLLSSDAEAIDVEPPSAPRNSAGADLADRAGFVATADGRPSTGSIPAAVHQARSSPARWTAR